MWHLRWLLFIPAVSHIWMGCCLLQNGGPLQTTVLSGLLEFLRWDVCAVMIILAGLMGIAASFVFRRSPVGSFMLLLPELIIMGVSRVKVWQCIQAGTFADGVRRDPDFIAADQAPLIVVGIGYFIAIAIIYWGSLFHLYNEKWMPKS